MKIHEIYIKRCLEIAKNGLGNTFPNPSVGCVIVHDGRIIGEGFTSKAGGPHAEVNAIRSVQDPSLLKKATLYVTLEPCSHHGKTPPCADLITAMEIPRVVIGTLDSNKEVSGRGVKQLIEHGCDVTIGVLEEECRWLNRRFFCFHENKRPFIILKWAESMDGYIAPQPETRNTENPKPVWLSGKTSRQLVHKWRSEEQAILVGTGTAIADNPALNTRDWFGNNPVRIVIDKTGNIPLNYRLFDGKTPTLVFTENLKERSQSVPPKVEFIPLNKNTTFPQQVCATLFERNIQSIIIEGGAATLNSFIKEDLWDEARVFRSDVALEAGITAPSLQPKAYATQQSGNDLLLFFRNEH